MIREKKKYKNKTDRYTETCDHSPFIGVLVHEDTSSSEELDIWCALGITSHRVMHVISQMSGGGVYALSPMISEIKVRTGSGKT